MPSIFKIALHAVALVALTGFAPHSAASPLSNTVPLAVATRPTPFYSISPRSPTSHDSNIDISRPYLVMVDHLLESRVPQLQKSFENLQKENKNLKNFSLKSQNPGNLDIFRSDSTNSLQLFFAYLFELLSLFTDPTNRGLINYDGDSDFETFLKDLNNEVKDLLKSVTVIVYNLPLLGPLLGPIVYQFKCDVDGALNKVVGLLDGLLDSLTGLRNLLDCLVDDLCALNFCGAATGSRWTSLSV
ncbi:hypothetical protein C8J56DRAFT_1159033 [Mycena floridula]|nr:hypothetical protein C8J56DRAFT_1159033 [Mycena floridula]